VRLIENGTDYEFAGTVMRREPAAHNLVFSAGDPAISVDFYTEADFDNIPITLQVESSTNFAKAGTTVELTARGAWQRLTFDIFNSEDYDENENYNQILIFVDVVYEGQDPIYWDDIAHCESAEASIVTPRPTPPPCTESERIDVFDSFSSCADDASNPFGNWIMAQGGDLMSLSCVEIEDPDWGLQVTTVTPDNAYYYLLFSADKNICIDKDSDLVVELTVSDVEESFDLTIKLDYATNQNFVAPTQTIQPGISEYQFTITQEELNSGLAADFNEIFALVFEMQSQQTFIIESITIPGCLCPRVAMVSSLTPMLMEQALRSSA
jgi:hypothetical protein